MKGSDRHQRGEPGHLSAEQHGKKPCSPSGTGRGALNAGLSALALVGLFLSSSVSMAQTSESTAPEASQSQTQAFWANLPANVRAACPLTPTVFLSDNEDPPLSIDYDHTLAQLESAREAAPTPAQPLALGDADGGAGQVVRTSQEMGVYSAASAMHSHAPIVLVNLGNGMHLACMPSVDILLTQSPAISVARELPPDSCPRQEVYTHEMGHYQIDRQAILQWEREGGQWGSQISGLYLGATPAQAEQEAQDSASALAKALAQRLSALREPAQRAHDSPEEYARLTASCGGQTAAIAQAGALHQLTSAP